MFKKSRIPTNKKLGRLIEETGLYLNEMKESDEDLCAALVTRENYAVVVSEISVETCSNEDARCQLRVVGESLFSSHLALGLQKSKKN